MISVILLLISIFLNLFLVVYILKEQPRSKLNQIFVFFCIASILWNGALLVRRLPIDVHWVHLLLAVFTFGKVLMPFAFFHLALELSGIRRRFIAIVEKLLYPSALLLYLLELSSWVSGELVWNPALKYYERTAGPSFILVTSLLIGIRVCGVAFLVGRMVKYKEVQGRLELVPIVFGASINIMLWLLNSYLRISEKYLPGLQSLANIIFYVALFYAFTLYRFKGLRLAFRKLLSYLTATAGITVGYILLGYFIEEITATDLEPQSHLALALTMVVIAGTYYPLILLFNRVFRKMFPLPQDKLYQTLRELGNSLNTVLHHEDLGLVVTNQLLRGLDLSGVGLYLWEKNSFRKLYSLGIDYGIESWVGLLSQREFKTEKFYLKGPAALSIPLWWNNALVGCLALRAKENAELLSAQDIEVLQTIVPQIAAALVNTKLYQDLADANLLNENILRNMPSGVMVWEPGGKVMLVNDALAEFAGLTKENLLSSNLYSHHELEPLYSVFETPGLQEVRLDLRPAVGIKTIAVSNTAFQLAEEVKFLSVLTDISDFKALQKQLARVERLSAMGTMTAGLAHEIRNGLHGIQGFTSLLEEASAGDSHLNRLAKGVREDAERLARMLNNFLHFASKPELKLETLSLDELLETSVMLVKRLHGTDRVNFAITRGKRELCGDRDKLYQVIINLLLNAAEAKGVTHVKVESEGKANGTLIRIEDDGEGIPYETAERAFDPFYTTKPTGTGLGLSIVHQIVTEHGGKVNIENTGCGTRVDIFLPDKGERK